MSGWDTVGSMTEEVENPARTLPKAFSIACVATYLQYFLVYGALAVANVEHWSKWEADPDEEIEPDPDEPLPEEQVPLGLLIRKILLPDGTAQRRREAGVAGRVVPRGGGEEGGEKIGNQINHDEQTTVGQEQNVVKRTSGEGGKNGGNGSEEENRSRTAWFWIAHLLIILVSACGTCGPYASELICSAHQVRGLVDENIVPGWTGLGYVHPKYGTPWGGILGHTLVCVVIVATLDTTALQLLDSTFGRVVVG